MLVSLTLEEIKQIKSVFEREIESIEEQLRENPSTPLARAMEEPVEQTRKLISYLDSKIPKIMIGGR